MPQTMGYLLQLGLSNAATTAALAVVVTAVTLPLRRRRPAVVHALWLLVLLKMLAPPLWAVPVRWAARAPEREGAPRASCSGAAMSPAAPA